MTKSYCDLCSNEVYQLYTLKISGSFIGKMWYICRDCKKEVESRVKEIIRESIERKV